MARRPFARKLIPGNRPDRWRHWLRRCWLFKVMHRDGNRMMTPAQVERLLEREGGLCTVGITPDGQFLVDRPHIFLN